eukprot:12077-Heterococcus_DN1.PRE.1
MLQHAQPPEVLEGRVGYEGAPADVWCAGVVLFLLLLGHPPFAMANRDDWWYRAYITDRTKAFWDSHLQHSATACSVLYSALPQLLLPQELVRRGHAGYTARKLPALPAAARDLLTSILRPDPASRPSVAELQ